MSLDDRKIKSGRIIAIVGSGALIVISIITFTQQVPALSHSKRTERIYDEGYVVALRRIGNDISKNETLAVDDIYPQATYFTDHQVKAPAVRSDRALVQFMWKNNISYLLVPESTSEPTPDNTPLVIQLAKKPFEQISDFYAKYIAVPKPRNNTPLQNNNTSVLRPDNNNNTQLNNNTGLNLRREVQGLEGDVFNKLFEKISDYSTESSVLHLYKLRSNVTRDNLYILTDKTRPILSVSLPINGTLMESKFGVLRLNVTGTARDADSSIKQVEISINDSPFELANPRAPHDWSTWSFSDIVTKGTKTIVVRATDNADIKAWMPINIRVE
jgi:hypothetical protein